MNGILPTATIPLATVAIFCSATPISINRSGKTFSNSSARVDSFKSAQSTTTFTFFWPASTTPTPNPSRVGFFSIFSSNIFSTNFASGLSIPSEDNLALHCRLFRVKKCEHTRHRIIHTIVRNRVAAQKQRCQVVLLGIFVWEFAFHRADFFEELFRLFFGGRFAVPAIVALYFGNALTRNGVRDDERRLLGDCLGLLHCLDKLSNIVAVYLEHMPVEGAILIGERLERHNVFDHAVYLNIVTVHHRREVRELIFTCEHRRLPRASLLLFSIAHKAVHAIIFSVHAERIRHASALAEPLAQGAGGRLHARETQSLRVPLQTAPELAQRHTFFDREIAGVRHRRVAHWHDMAVAEHESVALVGIRVFGVVPKNMKIKCGEDVGHVEGASRVPAPGGDQHLNYRLADLLRAFLECEHFCIGDRHSFSIAYAA